MQHADSPVAGLLQIPRAHEEKTRAHPPAARDPASTVARMGARDAEKRN